MRVLQLIDSLEAGGAERVAVNLANTLSKTIDKSFLCATRKEGILKGSISERVGYVFLNKQKTLDLNAIKSLNTFIKSNNINIIHAHSSSFFLATIITVLNRKVAVIWHDHYGNSEFLATRKHRILKLCSTYFSHIFSVNRALEIWAKQSLKFKNVSYLPNFATSDKNQAVTKLSGVDGKRIICLANLRPQKDHFTLIDAFKQVVQLFPDWTLHCVGKDFNDDYSKQIKAKIAVLGLQESIFVYGSKPDVFNILKQCEVGVLSSKSEGLPIALLEYGLAHLAVIATAVGECGSVVHNAENGLLINPLGPEALSEALLLYLNNKSMRDTYSEAFNTHVIKEFSEASQLKNILEIYNTAVK